MYVLEALVMVKMLTVEKLKELFFKRCKIRKSNNVLEAHHSIGQ